SVRLVFVFIGRGVAPGEYQVHNLSLDAERNAGAAAFFETFPDRLDGVSARLEGSEDVRTVGPGDDRRRSGGAFAPQGNRCARNRRAQRVLYSSLDGPSLRLTPEGGVGAERSQK